MLDSMCMYNILTKHHTLYAFTVCILNTCLGVNITPPLVEDVAYFVCHHSGKKTSGMKAVCVCVPYFVNFNVLVLHKFQPHVSISALEHHCCHNCISL